jgi:hypothetical protein
MRAQNSGQGLHVKSHTKVHSTGSSLCKYFFSKQKSHGPRRIKLYFLFPFSSQRPKTIFPISQKTKQQKSLALQLFPKRKKKHKKKTQAQFTPFPPLLTSPFPYDPITLLNFIFIQPLLHYMIPPVFHIHNTLPEAGIGLREHFLLCCLPATQT